MDLKDFEYHLPPHLIAQEPCSTRDQSRLLFLDRSADCSTGTPTHHHFSDLIDLLKPTDVLVVNDTKVIPARVIATRKSGGTIKLLLLKHEANKPGVWQAMVTPIKRLKPGEELSVQMPSGTATIQIIDLITGEDGYKRLLVNLGNQQQAFELLQNAGYAPLPPYISRNYASKESRLKNLVSSNSDPQPSRNEPNRQSDLNRYQTVFAQTPGAVAAPTAGLHFSDDLLNRLEQKGITICKITLHVGPGTFKPIENSIEEHFIESEPYSISQETAAIINKAKSEGRRIIAVGTTSCRALESAAENGSLVPITNGSTALYIRPGYQFKIIDGLITNFHLSKSSLLLLVSAFVEREKLMNAYQIAIENNYRFYSYGDAMLIL